MLVHDNKKRVENLLKRIGNEYRYYSLWGIIQSKMSLRLKIAISLAG